MEEVTTLIVLLSILITKVTSNHCITGDHISTYDNFISFPYSPLPLWPDVPFSSFASLPTKIPTGCGLNYFATGSCDKSGKSCRSTSGRCAKYDCGTSSNSNNCDTGSSTGKCKKEKREKISASECGLGAWNLLPPGFGCGCPNPCPCPLPKTTCCTSYPAPCGCPKTTCCTSFPSLPLPPCGGCPRSCCSNFPPCCNFPCGCGFPSIEISPCGLASGVLPCSIPSCGCPVPKTTTCTTIPFGNPICGKTTTCTTYPNPCGKSTTTCTTVPHANPACAKTTTCQTLPFDPCFPCCNSCPSLCGKSCSTCCSSVPGKCGNPLCKCGYCTCPSPCTCGYY